MRAKNRLLRNIILAVITTLFFLGIAIHLLGRKEMLRYIINAASSKSSWDVVVADYSWSFLHNQIAAENIKIINPKEKKELSVEKFYLRYRLWDLLRGKFYISSLQIKNAHVIIPQFTKMEKRKRFLDIKKLLFLKNLILRDVVVSGLEIDLPEGRSFISDEIQIGLRPAFLGEPELTIRADGASLLQKNKVITSFAALNLNSSTQLSKWGRTFPYVNAISGRLKLTNLNVKETKIDALNAVLIYKDNELVLNPFNISINDETLEGDLKADTLEEIWQLHLNIPKPISLPYIIAPIKTLDTKGEISGTVTAKGEKFDIREGTGEAEIKLGYLFHESKDYPFQIRGNLSWKGGIINIVGANVSANERSFYIDGFADIKGKNFNLTCSGENFPAESVFNIFSNPNFKRIYGDTNFTASLKGWGKDFVINGKAVTINGGYGPLIAARTDTAVNATYNDLSLDWKIFESDKEVGVAGLGVHFGKRIPGEQRSKDINLDVKIKEYPLANLLPGYGIEGNADGSLTITGPHLAFNGNAVANVFDGAVMGIPFDKMDAVLDISRRKIIFKNLKLIPNTMQRIDFPGVVNLDIQGGGIKIAGSPTAGLDLDIDYIYDGKLWRANKLSYADPSISGEVIKLSGLIKNDKSLDLKVDGLLNLNLLAPMGFLVREASGTAAVDFRILGVKSNPNLTGLIELNGCRIYPRQVSLPMEDLKGKLILKDKTVFFEDLSGSIDDGNFELKGKLSYNNFRVANTNLQIAGENLRFKTEDGSFRMEFNGDLSLQGDMPDPLLKGEIVILDGKYTKDFDIIEQVSRSVTHSKITGEEKTFFPRLDLHVRNTGDLLIKNNIGDISLRTDLDLKGSEKKPVASGAVEVVSGELHYMGMKFEITRGFVEFKESLDLPYLEITAQREMGVYNISMELHGDINNLDLELSGTSPAGFLEKRDVVSLIAFGMTEAEREQMAANKGEKLGVSMAAQQLTHLVERPISKLARLDRFRFEASDPGETSISRLTLGKQVSDRLSVDFATDINTKDAEQTIIAEYLFTDNLLVKGSRSTDGQYELSGVLRFSLR